MKIRNVLTFCALAVMTGCDHSEPAPKGLIKSGDSPIVVSDGSVHFKHHSNGTKDFHMVDNGNGTLTLSTPDGFSVKEFVCVTGDNCPASALALSAGWSIQGLDSSAAQIFLASSPDSTDASVQIVVYKNDLDSTVDNGTDTSGGTELVQPETKLGSIKVVQKTGGSPTTVTCNSTCKFKINHN